VLANVRLSFGLVTTRPNCADDGAAVNRQGATGDRRVPSLIAKVPPPTGRVPQTTIRVPPSTVRVPPLPRCVDHGGHRSRHMDPHVSPHGGRQLSWFMINIESRGGREIERTMDYIICSYIAHGNWCCVSVVGWTCPDF
jgi:hypothetical protein